MFTEMMMSGGSTQTLVGKYIETCRTNVDNGASGYMTLYANGRKSYSTSVTGSMISGRYNTSAQYTFSILKRCRLIIMDFATSKIETDEIKDVGYTFDFPFNNYKEIIAIDEE